MEKIKKDLKGVQNQQGYSWFNEFKKSKRRGQMKNLKEKEVKTMTKEDAKKWLKEQFDYHINQIVSNLLNNKSDVELNHYFADVVDYLFKLINSDWNHRIESEELQQIIFKSFTVSEIKDLINTWLDNDSNLGLLKRLNYINDFKYLEEEIKQKEIEVKMLRLRLLKKKLLKSEKEDVVFDDIEIMKEILEIWRS